MANSIKYSESTEQRALNKGNWWIGTGDTNKGPTEESGYWNAINPPSGGYTVYLTKESNGPSIHSINSYENLISFTNKISGNNYVNVAECLVYYQTQDDKLCVNREYENIVTDGLVLNLDAGYVPSYPTTGTTWYDLSGNGNNGSLTNGPTFNRGIHGNISFDGVDDYADLGNSLVGLISTAYTFSIWSKNEMSIENVTGNQAIELGIANNLIAFNIENSVDGGDNVISTGITNQDEWKLITVTYDGFNVKIYNNDEVILTQTRDVVLPTLNNLRINYLSSIGVIEQTLFGSNATYYLSGNVSNILAYNRALTEQEVLQNYNSTKNKYKFIITVDTTKAGSASDTFVLPLVSGESYDFDVDWGDGNVESVSGSSLTSKSHTYSSGGTYQISITGDFPRIYFNNGGDCLKLSSIDNWSDISWSSMMNAFNGCSNMNGTYTDAPDLSSVTSLRFMFGGCSSFNHQVNFDTSNVTNMSYMFRDCSSFNQSVSNFDTSNVTTIRDMFSFCQLFNQSVSNFDTSNVTDISFMFTNCTSFNQSVSNFDTSNVTNMRSMFNGCSSFNQSVSNFDTSNVTNMRSMFNGCSSFNQSVSNFDTSNVTNMENMFRVCLSFKQSLATFDMTSVTDVTQMLFDCNINETGTTTNYDNTLIAWETQDLVDGLSFNGGSSKYSLIGETARDAIINDDNWTITDGGLET